MTYHMATVKLTGNYYLTSKELQSFVANLVNVTLALYGNEWTHIRIDADGSGYAYGYPPRISNKHGGTWEIPPDDDMSPLEELDHITNWELLGNYQKEMDSIGLDWEIFGIVNDTQ